VWQQGQRLQKQQRQQHRTGGTWQYCLQWQAGADAISDKGQMSVSAVQIARAKTLGGQGSGLLSEAVLLLNPEHLFLF